MPETLECPKVVPLPSDPYLEGAGGALGWPKGGQQLLLRGGKQEAHPGWQHARGHPGCQTGQAYRWPRTHLPAACWPLNSLEAGKHVAQSLGFGVSWPGFKSHFCYFQSVGKAFLQEPHFLPAEWLCLLGLL